MPRALRRLRARGWSRSGRGGGCACGPCGAPAALAAGASGSRSPVVSIFLSPLGRTSRLSSPILFLSHPIGGWGPRAWGLGGVDAGAGE